MPSLKIPLKNTVLAVLLLSTAFPADLLAVTVDIGDIAPSVRHPKEERSVPASDIFKFDEMQFAGFSPKRSSSASFYDSDEDIIISNAYYTLAIDKHNGGIRYISDLRTGDKVSLGGLSSSLWKLDVYGGETRKNSDFSADSKTAAFSYKWSGSALNLLYEDKAAGLKVENRITAKSGNYFDIEVAITNNGEKPVTSLTLPYNITFSVSKLKRFIYPTQLGIALKPGFFSSRKSVFENNYIFSDFACWESKAGNLGIYTIQKGDGIWTEPEYNIGYSSAFGGVGTYSYKLLTYVAKGQTWTSPKIRFRVGESPLETAYFYSRDNDLGEDLSLKQKLGSKLFDEVSRSVLLKLDFAWIKRPFKEVKEFLKTLPSPTLVHIVAFWPKGFDRNYPDYLPPNKDYGTLEDLRDFDDTAHKQGLLVMPYTNPTWWNDSPTVQKLGRENIAVKDLSGKVADESYWNGQNWGIVVCPYHPDVVARTRQTLKEFTETIPCDLLFEDQIGARWGIYDLNPKARSPIAYKQGLIDTARQGSKKLPIMIEAGYDGLLPYTVGFCGVTVNDTLPPDKSYDVRFGEDNWEIFPLALYWAHDKVGFYHHNLAHQVFIDNGEKLTWSLAYGYNMYIGYWPDGWNDGQKKWFEILDAIQKHVAVRYFGKRLTDFKTLDDGATLSVFEDIAILANHSAEKTFRADDNIIAKSGFMARSEDGGLTAGLFTKFNGDKLAGEHLLIVEKSDHSINILQPDPKDTMISITRPDDWSDASAIRGYCGEKEIPLAVAPLKISFYYDAKDTSGGYIIKYKEKRSEDMGVYFDVLPQYVPIGEKFKVTVSARNRTGRKIKNGKLALSWWLVKPSGSSPDMAAGLQSGGAISSLVSDEFASLPSGKEARAEFQVEAPGTAEDGSLFWIKAEAVYNDNGATVIKSAQTKVNIISRPVEVALEPSEAGIFPGEKAEFTITVKNNFSGSKDVALSVETGLPKELVELSSPEVTVDGNEQKNIKLVLGSTPQQMGKSFQIGVNATVNNRSSTAQPASLHVFSPMSRVGLGPQHILIKDKEQKIKVSVEAAENFKLAGAVKLKAPSGWKVSPESQPYVLEVGGKKDLEFSVIPTSEGKADMTAQVSSNGISSESTGSFCVIGSGQAALLEADINQDKETGLVMGNNLVEVQETKIIGGRILAFYLRNSGNNQLYTAYPYIKRIEGDNVWTEYGGINDWFPEGWPGDVWNNTWEYKIIESGPKAVAVEMSTKSKNGLAIKKVLRLEAGSPELKVKYSISNPTDKRLKFVWASHPDLAPGGGEANGDDIIMIPTQQETVRRQFSESLSKSEYVPDKDWCLAQNRTTGEYFAQRFDRKLVDKIGVWEGVGFFTMELIFKPVELGPSQEFDFDIGYIAGKGEWKE